MNKKKYGVLIGLERGKKTYLSIGGEAQFKRVKLKRPPTLAVNLVMNYNFKQNILGYDLGGWYRKGRIGLTWGCYLNMATNFEQTKLGITPALGYKFLGIHFQTGYKFFTKPEPEIGKSGEEAIFDYHNTFFVSLRYFLAQKRKTKLATKKPFKKK